MQRIAIRNALRSAHLLPVADRIRFAWLVASGWRSRRHFRQAHPDFPVAGLADIFDAYGKLDLERFRRSGLEVASVVANRIRRVIPEPRVILEWGVGPGRVIRNLQDEFPGAIILDSDYNSRSVAWCATELGGCWVTRNGLQPPLDLPDASVDAVYGLSVFTHLGEEAHGAWSRELHRVLVPGGVLVLTLNGDAVSKGLSDAERREYEAGRLVTAHGEMEGKKFFAALHPEQYVRGSLLRDFEVVGHETDYGVTTMRQDLWTAVKP